MKTFHRIISRVAKIDDKLRFYDICSSTSKDIYDSENFEYIGMGCIHSINGVKQEIETSFFDRKYSIETYEEYIEKRNKYFFFIKKQQLDSPEWD